VRNHFEEDSPHTISGLSSQSPSQSFLEPVVSCFSDVLRPQEFQSVNFNSPLLFGEKSRLGSCPEVLVSPLLQTPSVIFDAMSFYLESISSCPVMSPLTQPPRLSSGEDAEHTPLERVGGLFQVPISKVLCPPPPKASFLTLADDGELVTSPCEDSVPDLVSQFSCALYGQSFLSGDLDLWHRRMRHISKEHLKRIASLGLVDGFNLTGNTNAQCGCDTCVQAKIKKARSERQRHFPRECKFIGEHVSSDIKSLPFETFEGHKYVICFVDHYSRLGICYLMRTKDEATEKFKSFCKEIGRAHV